MSQESDITFTAPENPAVFTMESTARFEFRHDPCPICGEEKPVGLFLGYRKVACQDCTSGMFQMLAEQYAASRTPTNAENPEASK